MRLHYKDRLFVLFTEIIPIYSQTHKMLKYRLLMYVLQMSVNDVH
jgi:hypothetical protein